MLIWNICCVKNDSCHFFQKDCVCVCVCVCVCEREIKREKECHKSYVAQKEKKEHERTEGWKVKRSRFYSTTKL